MYTFNSLSSSISPSFHPQVVPSPLYGAPLPLSASLPLPLPSLTLQPSIVLSELNLKGKLDGCRSHVTASHDVNFPAQVSGKTGLCNARFWHRFMMLDPDVCWWPGKVPDNHFCCKKATKQSYAFYIILGSLSTQRIQAGPRDRDIDACCDW